ncbi:MAG: glycosyltransferase family 9 protein [bacterium]
MSERPVALVLRALYLGDLLTGLPALALLRRALPEHRIVLAAPSAVGRLALLAGSVDDVVPARELDPLLGAPTGADVAVDLHGKGPESRDLLAATAPRRLIAFDYGTVAWRADEHEVQRWCRLIGTAFAADLPWPGVAGSLPVPFVAPAERARMTVVHPGAKAASRRWPPRRYMEVARALAADGHEVVVTGGPGEEELAGEVAKAAGVGLRTGLSLDRLLALIASARLVISGDTGVAHIASAYRTPSVVMFGPVSPQLWGPPADPRHQALWPAAPDYRGDPHAARTDPVLLQITVTDVLASVPQSLAAAAPGNQPVDGTPSSSRRSA